MSVKFLETDNLAEQSTELTPAKPNISALTGLRFIAAFMVFISHTPRSTWVLNTIPSNLLGVGFGYFGVSIFFILSGFVITLNYYDWFARGKALKNVKKYAVARFARIYPVYLFAFLLVFFTEPNVTVPEGFPALPFLHLALLQSWLPNFKHSLYIFNGVAWSVSCEAFFYLAFPFVARFLLPKIKTVFSLSGSILITIGLVLSIETYLWIDCLYNGNPDRAIFLIYIFPPVRFLDFFLGCLIARMYYLLKERPVSRRERTIANICLVVGFFIDFILWINFDAVFGFFYYDGPFIISFGFIIFYLARYPLTGIFKFITGKKMMLLGEASYSFYLLHEYLFLLTQESVRLSNNLFFVFSYEIFILSLTILLSVAVYKFIEVPARRYIRQKWG